MIRAIAALLAYGIAGAGFAGILIYATLADGFVLMHMWDWFLSEPFGLPRLGLFHAAGISTIVGFMAHQFNGVHKEHEKQRWVHTFLDPWVRFFVGWCIYKAMVSL